MCLVLKALKQKRRKFWQNFFEKVKNREKLDLPDIQFGPPERRTSNNNMDANEDETDLEFGIDDPDNMDADEDEPDIDIGVDDGINFHTFIEQTEDEEYEDDEYDNNEYGDDEYEDEEPDNTIEYGLIETPKIVSIEAFQDVDEPIIADGDNEVCRFRNQAELTLNRPLGEIIERNTPTIPEVDRLDTDELILISPKKENTLDPYEFAQCVTPALSFVEDSQEIKMEEENNTELDIILEIKQEIEDDDTATVIVNENTGVNADVLELKEDLADVESITTKLVEQNALLDLEHNHSKYSFSDEEIRENIINKNQLIYIRNNDNYLLQKYLSECQDHFANQSFISISESDRGEFPETSPKQNTSRDKQKIRLQSSKTHLKNVHRSSFKKSRNNRDTSSSESNSGESVLVKQNLKISKNTTSFERPKKQLQKSQTPSDVSIKSPVNKSRYIRDTSDSDSNSGESFLVKQNLNISKNRTNFDKPKNQLQNSKTHSDVFVKSPVKKSRNNHDTSDSDSEESLKQNLNISKRITRSLASKNQLQNSKTKPIVFVKSPLKKLRHNIDTSDLDSNSGESLKIKQNLNIPKSSTRSTKSKNKLQNSKTQADVFIKSPVKESRNNHDTRDSDSISGESLIIKRNLFISKNNTRSAKSKNKLQNSKTQAGVFIKSPVKESRNNHDTRDSDSNSGESLIIKRNLNISKNNTRSAKSKNKLQNSKTQSVVLVKSPVKESRYNIDTSDLDSNSGESLIIKQNLNIPKSSTRSVKSKNKLQNSKTHSDVSVKTPVQKSRYNIDTSDLDSNSGESLIIKQNLNIPKSSTRSTKSKNKLQNSKTHSNVFVKSPVKKSRNNHATSDSDSNSEESLKQNLNISKSSTRSVKSKNKLQNSKTHSDVSVKTPVQKSRYNIDTSDLDSNSGESLIIKQNLNIPKSSTRSTKSKNKLQNSKTHSDVFVKSPVKISRNNHDTHDSDSNSGESLIINQNLNISKSSTRSVKSKNKLQNSKTHSDVSVKTPVQKSRHNLDTCDSDSNSEESLIIKQNLYNSKNITSHEKPKNQLHNSKTHSDVSVKTPVQKSRNNHDTSDSDSSSGESLMLKQNLKNSISFVSPKKQLQNSKTQLDVFVKSSTVMKSRYNLRTSNSKSNNSKDSMFIADNQKKIQDTTINNKPKSNLNNAKQHLDFFIKSPVKDVQDPDVSDSSHSSESILLKSTQKRNNKLRNSKMSLPSTSKIQNGYEKSDLNSNHTIESPSYSNHTHEEFLKKKQQKSNLRHHKQDDTPKMYKNTKSQLDQSKNSSNQDDPMNDSCKSNKIEMNKRGNTSKNLRHFDKVLNRKRISSPIKRCHSKKLKVDDYFQNKSMPNVEKNVRKLDSNSFFSDELW